MRTKRVKRWIYEYLDNGTPKNTLEIADHIKTRSKFGISQNALVNILGKDKRFRKVGNQEVNHSYGTYTVVVWDIDHNVPRGVL